MKWGQDSANPEGSSERPVCVPCPVRWEDAAAPEDPSEPHLLCASSRACFSCSPRGQCEGTERLHPPPNTDPEDAVGEGGLLVVRAPRSGEGELRSEPTARWLWVTSYTGPSHRPGEGLGRHGNRLVGDKGPVRNHWSRSPGHPEVCPCPPVWFHRTVVVTAAPPQGAGAKTSVKVFSLACGSTPATTGQAWSLPSALGEAGG